MEEKGEVRTKFRRVWRSTSRNEAASPRNEEPAIFHLWLRERELYPDFPSPSLNARPFLLRVHATMRSRTLTSRERKLWRAVSNLK